MWVTAYLRYGVPRPVILLVSQHLDEQSRNIDEGIAKSILAGLDNTDSDVRIFCQAGGNDQSSGAATTNEIIVTLPNELISSDEGRLLSTIDPVDAIGSRHFCNTIQVLYLECSICLKLFVEVRWGEGLGGSGSIDF